MIVMNRCVSKCGATRKIPFTIISFVTMFVMARADESAVDIIPATPPQAAMHAKNSAAPPCRIMKSRIPPKVTVPAGYMRSI